jgi:hypothetical protein
MQQGYEKELPEDDPWRIETCRSVSYSVLKNFNIT